MAAATLSALFAAAQINQPTVPGYYARGTGYYEIQNYAGTADQLRRAARSRQLSPAEQRRLEYCMAMSEFNRGRYDAAEQQLRAWLERWGGAPERTDVLMSVGDCLFTHSYAEALSVYDRVQKSALADTERQAELEYRRGYCCLKLALWDRADAAFASLESDPAWKDAAHFYRAYILYARGDYAAAKQAFLACNTNKAPGDMADFYLSQIYYNEGDYTRALPTAQALLRRGDAVPVAFRAEANRIAGESLYLTGNSRDAVGYLRNYVADTETPALSALYILGLSEYGSGQYTAAEKTLRPVTADDSAMGQNAYLYIGQALLKTGDTDGAIMAFDRALHMTHDQAAREAAYYNYAVARYSGGTVPFGSSVTTFEEFLTLFPDSRYAEDVRRYIITGYVTDDNYEAALAAINRVKKPSDAVLGAKQQVLYTLGARNLAAGNAEAALSQLRQARGLSRHNAQTAREVELALGEAMLRTGDFDGAAEALRGYLQGSVTANTPVALYDLGYALMGLHEYADAASAFDRMIKNPGDMSTDAVADAWTRMGDCRYYQKDWSNAVAAYDKAYNISPSSADYVLFQKSVIQGYTGDFTGKLKGLERLEREFPSSALLPDALLEMTEAQLRTGDTKGAITVWRRLIQNYPETAQGRQAYLQMALTMTDTGNTDSAVETYKELITRFPTSDEGAQAVEALKRIYASRGDMDSFMTFMAGVDNAPRIDPGEAERTAFEVAEQQFLDGEGSKLLQQYVSRYGDNGAQAVTAYAYLMDEADESGNMDDALKYARRIVNRWPDNSAAELAYAILGQSEYAAGNGEEALEAWKQLERRASTPALANEARLGIMRVARDLARPDDLARAAEAVLASSTVGAEDKTEALFSRGLAMQLRGDDRGAIRAWQDMASMTDELYGAKAAVYLAETQLAVGDKSAAQATAEKFVNSGTPHAYWLARGFIVLADALKAQGQTYQAREYLMALRDNYPGKEADIFSAIDERLAD